VDKTTSSFSYSKSRLRAGYSYPIKYTELESALSPEIIKALFYVHLDSGSPETTIIMSAHYSGECHRNSVFGGGYGAGLTSVTLSSVLSKNKAAVHDLLIEKGFPLLNQWIGKAMSAGDAWRASDHGILFEFNGGVLICRECN